MSLSSAIATTVASLVTSTTLRDVQRRTAEWRRRLRGAPHRIDYFHQVDDPYSHLAAQTLDCLVARYDVELAVHLVGPPAAAAAPERARLEAFARKDAADVAPAYGLAFPVDASSPPPAAVTRVIAELARTPADRLPARAVDRGNQLWAGQIDAISAVSDDDRATAAAAVATGDALRGRLGHYLGATFHYAGEWYWGVDRLHYLEERLRSLAADKPGCPSEPIVAAPHAPFATTATTSTTGTESVQLEFFLSLRSPYTYIAMPRTYELAHRHNIEIVLRPVLPMVMRGLAVPHSKRMYIVRDTKREADRVGVPFGRICDPVGAPVEKGFALYHWARDHGRDAAYLHAFARAAFADGIDTGSDAGLRHVVESSGLSWREAQQHRGDQGWREELEANRLALLELGLWGVPSFRVCGGGRPDFATWGQDRLWLVEREILTRLAT